MGQSKTKATFLRHYKLFSRDRLDLVDGTVHSNCSLTTRIFPLLVRRAKLGFVYWVGVPVLEALARHQVLSVASALATTLAKRTQGGHGLQCDSVKGLSPVMK